MIAGEEEAAGELRARAEAAFRKRTAQTPESLEALSPEAIRQLLHELRARQIELEMQNEELRRAQVALDVSRARYFDLHDLAPAGYVTLSETGMILQANLTAATLLGVTRSALVQQPLSRFILKEDADSYDLLRKNLLATGGAQTCELRMTKGDGTTFWAHLAATAAPDESGSPDIRVVLSNIAARHQAEAALQESEATQRDILNSLPAHIAVLDKAGVILAVNEPWLQFARENGNPPLAKIGEAADYFEICRSACHAGDASAEAAVAGLRAVLSGKQTRFSLEYPCDAPGCPRWFAMEVIRSVGPHGGAVVAHTEITARRQAEHEREILERKMQETQKLESLGVLAGGIAHDFNNLLTGILGNASLASAELPPGSPLHAYLRSINEGSRRAADLCKQMLAYSGRGRFVVQKLDLGQLVEETAQMLKISISKKAALRFHLEKGLPPLEADATQIRQVIMNLVINASEAIGEESGVIALSTGLARVDHAYLAGAVLAPELPEGEYVFLEVSDTGCGMNAETQTRIFDPFFTTKFTGRGLGLAAVLGIVRGHKGAMKVESEPGRGTTFRLLFPAQSGSGEAAEAHAAAERWQGRGTVLVVDDEETVRSITARMLPHIGFDSVLVADGLEAVEVFRADPDRFALVLLDLTMPHMGGEETFAELQKLRAGVRVVLMSGYNEQDALVRFPGNGPASFLQKPFTIDHLRTVLQGVLG